MERYDSANTPGLVYELDGSSPDYKEQLWQNKTHISLKLSQPTLAWGTPPNPNLRERCLKKVFKEGYIERVFKVSED